MPAVNIEIIRFSGRPWSRPAERLSGFPSIRRWAAVAFAGMMVSRYSSARAMSRLVWNQFGLQFERVLVVGPRE